MFYRTFVAPAFRIPLNLIAAILVAGCSPLNLASTDIKPFNMVAKNNVLIIRHDAGGVLGVYARNSIEIRNNNINVRFEGNCESACTLYLSLPRDTLCVAPNATFGFHLPYGRSAKNNQIAAEYLLVKYPAWVRNWIKNQGGLNEDIIVMKFDFARKHLPLCKLLQQA